jgi:hypothetical protein
MADRFITRNGVRKVIDGSNPAMVETARAKGWAFEDESDPAPVADAPEALAAEGPPAFVRMSRDGVEKDVAPDLLETARAKGWAEVPTERAEYVQPGARPATLGDKAQATAQGFIRGASLNSDIVQDYAGAVGDQVADWFDDKRSSSFDESLAMVRANREAVAAKAPGYAIGGEIAGTVASAVTPGGAANLAGKVGTAAAAKAAPAIATKLGAGLLGRALTAGTGLVAEGAAYDAASTIAGGDEEFNKAVSTGDWKGAAERLVVKPLEGAALNVVGGAVVHGVTAGVKLGLKSLRKGATEAVEAADGELVQALDNDRITRAESTELQALETGQAEQTRQALDAAEDSATLETKALTELEQNLERAKPKALPEPGNDAVKMARAFEAAESFDVHARENVSKLKDALDVLEVNAEYADVELGLAAKNRAIKAAENGYGQAIADPEVATMLDGFATRFRREAETALDDQTAKRLTGLAALADRAKAYTGRKLSAGDVGDAYEVLDAFKREVGRMAQGKRGPVRDTARNVYREVKPFMEREDLFGEAAKLQKPFNAVWAPEIGAESADAIQGMWGKTGRANTADEFAKAERVRAAWVEAHLKNTAEGASDTDEALRQYIATKTASQSVRADLLGSAEGLERAAKSREAMATALRILDENAAKKAGKREWDALETKLTRENLLGGGLKHQGAAAAVKFAAEQTVGRVPIVGSAVANALAGKLTASELKTALRTAQQQAEKNAVIRQAGVERAAAAVKAAQAARDRAATKAASKANWTGKVDRVLDKTEPSVRRAAVRKAVLELDRDDDQAGPLSALEPVLGHELTRAYAEQRAARNAFLRDKAGTAPAATPFGTPARVLADEEADRLGRYMAAADDPTAALERLADGNRTAEDLETLRVLFPSTLQEFRSKVLAAVAERRTPLDYESQLALAQSLGLDAQMHGTAAAFWSGVARKGQEQDAAKASSRKLQLPGSRAASQGDRVG